MRFGGGDSGALGRAQQVGRAAHLPPAPAGVSPPPPCAAEKENASKPEGRAVPRPRDSRSAPRGCGPSRPPGKDEVVGRRRRAASENQDPRRGSCPAVPVSDTCHFKHSTTF